jgi:dipeptidyl aminopeptidase/acylaminoacyl peptidase
MMLGCLMTALASGGTMKSARALLLNLFVVLLATAPLAGQPTPATAGKRAMTFDDLLGMYRVGDPQISPDGKWIAYTLGAVDKAANRTVRNIWLAPVAGGEPRQLTSGGRDLHARWSPDGKWLAFLSTRDGTAQVWLISLEGGEATKLTNLSTGADNVMWSPDGKWLAFTSEVFPDCRDDACNEKRDAEREKSKVKARAYDALLYRHWDAWEDGKRSHLFVISVAGGTPRDLTAGADYDVPPVQRGSGEDLAWSPDSKELCFTAVTDPVEAISTNGDLFVVPAGGGEIKKITTNGGFDGNPAYSPDGRWIAYHSQARAGFEADLWRLVLYDRQSGKHTVANEKFDRSVENILWSPDSKTIYFAAEDQTVKPIYSVVAAPGAEPKQIVKDTYTSEVGLSRDGRMLVFSRVSMTAPTEVYTTNSDGTGARQITRHNAEKLAQLDLNAPEKYWFAGAGGTQVHAMLVRPPGFAASKKYPLLLIAHGGPQTMWSDAWSYRWNPQLFASPGYVVLLINRRGSTGFGQKFTDEIRGDYGGKAFEDLMLGVDAALKKFPFIDGSRLGAAGASYGGFMMNWFAGHTKGRFKCIVTHASMYDQASFYGATEELWFPEWDQLGRPWTNPEVYRKESPGTYAAEFGKYKTPTLVIHGEQDYRVPYTEGLAMYTALQRQGVPSRLVIFPDEGHWILKPQNSEFWYREVLGWLAKYLK